MLAGEFITQGLHHARFANAGFRRQQHHLSFAAFCQFPPLAQQTQFMLPSDHIVAERIDKDARTKVVGRDIPEGWIGLDIGPKTQEAFLAVLSSERGER